MTTTQTICLTLIVALLIGTEFVYRMAKLPTIDTEKEDKKGEKENATNKD